MPCAIMGLLLCESQCLTEGIQSVWLAAMDVLLGTMAYSRQAILSLPQDATSLCILTPTKQASVRSPLGDLLAGQQRCDC